MLKYLLYVTNIIIFSFLSYELLKEKRYTEKPKPKKKSHYQLILINPPRANIYDAQGKPLTRLTYTYTMAFKKKINLLYDDKNCIIYPNTHIFICHTSIEQIYNNWELINFFDVNIYPVFKRTKIFSDIDVDFVGNATFASGRKKTKIVRKIIRDLKKTLSDKKLIKSVVKKIKYIDILAGNFGLELYYDQLLRGKIGVFKKLNERTDTLIKPLPGRDLYLTINLELQSLIKKELKDFCKKLTTNCATVGINAENGEILFFVETKKENLEKANKQSYFSTIYQGLYLPGSIFKPFIALALLESGIIDRNHTTFCSGAITTFNRNFKCWASRGHGYVNVVSAIEQSCNVFFYHNIQKFKQQSLKDFIEKFKIDKITKIDLPFETSQKVSISPNILNRILFSIGQSDIYISLLKIVQLFALFHTNEYLPTPHLVQYPSATLEKKKIAVKVNKKNLEIVKEGLFKVIHSPSGTAHGLGLEKFKLYGKTGTVQVGGNLKPNSIFCGLLEINIPISFCVLIENSGSGKEFAGKFTTILLNTLKNFFSAR
ncbi:MAG: penicillin-binding transpeptidase domain-containing protein [Planctomycetota bacterium]